MNDISKLFLCLYFLNKIILKVTAIDASYQYICKLFPNTSLKWLIIYLFIQQIFIELHYMLDVVLETGDITDEVSVLMKLTY